MNNFIARDFLLTLLSLSITGTLLMFILFILKPIYRRIRINQQWQYYIWLVVIFFFLFPIPNPSASFPSLPKQFDFYSAPTNTWPNSESIESNHQQPLPPANKESIVHTITPEHISQYLLLGWILIAFLCFLHKMIAYIKFLHFLHTSKKKVSDIAALDLLSNIQKELHIRKSIELYYHPFITSPLLVGFWNPCIVIPNKDIPISQLNYILKHELIHYKYLDIHYKWLVVLTKCIHWFNPFLYILSKEININCELACDERVIRNLTKEERKYYGDILITSLKNAGTCQKSIATITLTENVKQLKERLGAIMNTSPRTLPKTILSIILAFSIISGGAVISSYAAPAPKTLNLPNSISEEQNDDKKTNYIQRSYYLNSYIIELGYNLSEEATEHYPTHKNITLNDQSQITIFFEKQAKDFANDSTALSTIQQLLSALKQNRTYKELRILTPLIVNVTPLENDLEVHAEEFYNNKELSQFSAIFSALEESLKEEYMERIFEDKQISFYSALIHDLSQEQSFSYANRSMEDGQLNFFIVHLGYLEYSEEEINTFAETAYQNNQLTFFTLLVPYLSDENKDEWITRTLLDKKAAYHSLLTES